ncbi:MAG TPA: 50S ribosome-binding GTPase, partial [Leptospiraceae bacterium]|nr:50S ribosome-binding GTPase [Leptospiraceae bacterium]
MKKYPIVSIVGRQNTGKSTLFNAVFKKNLAITYDYPGVTRDVIKGVYEDSETEQKFLLCDTPGLDIENIDDLSESIIQLAFQQLIDSNVILFLIDKNDIRTYDWKLIKLFREDRRFNDKKILYVLNKADNPDEELDFDQFYRAGIKEIIPISALGRRNLKLLLQTVF